MGSFLKRAAVFAVMVAVTNMLLNYADKASGGALSKVGAV